MKTCSINSAKMWLWCTTRLQSIQDAHIQLTSNGLALVATSHREASVIDSYLLDGDGSALSSQRSLV